MNNRWGGKVGVAYVVDTDTPNDIKANMNTYAWIQNVNAGAHAIASFAVNLEEIPPAPLSEREMLAKRTLPPLPKDLKLG